MKKVFFTVFLALCCTMGFAQLSFNVKAGLNLSSYIGDNSDHSKFKPGARVGVGMEYQFTDLVSLQPSLFFSQKGAKYSEGYDGRRGAGAAGGFLCYIMVCFRGLRPAGKPAAFCVDISPPGRYNKSSGIIIR